MKWWPTGLLAAAAAASASNVAALTFEHLLDPRWGSEAQRLQAILLITIAALSAAGVWLTVRGASARWALAVVVLMLAGLRASHLRRGTQTRNARPADRRHPRAGSQSSG